MTGTADVSGSGRLAATMVREQGTGTCAECPDDCDGSQRTQRRRYLDPQQGCQKDAETDCNGRPDHGDHKACTIVSRTADGRPRTSKRQMLRHPPSALASAARHRLRGPHMRSSRAGRFNQMPSPAAIIIRQQRAQAHRQQQEEARAECSIHDLWRHCP